MTLTVGIWIVGIAVAFAVGWSRGRVHAPAITLDRYDAGFKAGYLQGFEEMKQRGIEISEQNDLALRALLLEQFNPTLPEE